MKILLVANCGFGDSSWMTSWPRLWAEKGYEVDVFLMRYTGNPYHANPYVRKMFIEEIREASKKIRGIIEKSFYDCVLIPDTTCDGTKEVIEVTKGMNNVHLFQGTDANQTISGLELPSLTKPEWYFTEKEFNYIEKLKLTNSILIHPISSGVNEKSRNINFDLVIECSKKLEGVVVVYGGLKYLPINDLKRMEDAGVKLLWEDYNCFNDESGTVLGKFFVLASLCRAGIHGWSGSFTLSMGYNKPYVMVAPGPGIRANSSSPYIDTKLLYEQGMHRAKRYKCLNPSIWAITDKADIIVEAIKHVLTGKTGTYDKEWEFKEP